MSQPTNYTELSDIKLAISSNNNHSSDSKNVPNTCLSLDTGSEDSLSLVSRPTTPTKSRTFEAYHDPVSDLHLSRMKLSSSSKYMRSSMTPSKNNPPSMNTSTPSRTRCVFFKSPTRNSSRNTSSTTLLKSTTKIKSSRTKADSIVPYPNLHINPSKTTNNQEVDMDITFISPPTIPNLPIPTLIDASKKISDEKEKEERLSTIKRNSARSPNYHQSQATPYSPFGFNQSTAIRVNNSYYHKKEQLGKGGFGNVYKVLSTGMDTYALKVIPIHPNTSFYSYRDEVEILQSLKGNPHIIELVDFEFDQDSKSLKVVMECGGNDLETILKQDREIGLNMAKIRSYWQHILEAVNTIHKEGLIHSDLKPSNFVMCKSRLKVIDFGIAQVLDPSHLVNSVPQNETQRLGGTPSYLAPEVWCNIRRNQKGLRADPVDQKVDIWSLGCILYFMLYGRSAFPGAAIRLRSESIRKQEWTAHFHPYYQCSANPNLNDSSNSRAVPPLAIDVIQKCFCYNPWDRPTVQDLLNHPFLKD